MSNELTFHVCGLRLLPVTTQSKEVNVKSCETVFLHSKRTASVALSGSFHSTCSLAAKITTVPTRIFP
ncbi:hypothetical protein SKAU_G00390510 [Synaphobranchus kaupii]|uniref:Uncharacterized protein n=1 Tax=Synaphobranchus kaupii TaxID=118154 RepID=A0A9Q1EBG3_SYNKA|nr:hypothetical protein SKAU_G00390510 [Synaphobranchus kaupii]